MSGFNIGRRGRLRHLRRRVPAAGVRAGQHRPADPRPTTATSPRWRGATSSTARACCAGSRATTPPNGPTPASSESSSRASSGWPAADKIPPMQYSVILDLIDEPGFEGYYYAHVPTLDLTTQGKGIEGAVAAARDLAATVGGGETLARRAGTTGVRHRDRPLIDTLNSHLTAGRTRAVGCSNMAHQRFEEANEYADKHAHRDAGVREVVRRPRCAYTADR